MTGRLQLNPSPSFLGILISEGEMTTIFAASNAAWAKANAQKTRHKAATAAKKASEREAMDDSVEIHAPEETLQLPSKRASSNGSSKAKRTKTKATSSGSCEPKSVVSAVERPSSHG